jgi:polyisoprenyl-phosphate glycosyltransferase
MENGCSDGIVGASQRCISVVIPAHNEEAGIERAVQVIGGILDSCHEPYEIVIVDDGSRDGTYEKIVDLAAEDGRIRGVRFSRNFGKEAALLAGLRASKGEAVITIDADLQHPPALIPELIRLWRNGAKIVHGFKRERGGDGQLKRWRAALFNWVLSKLGGVDVRNSSDFKLLDRLVVETIANRLPEKRRFYRGLTDWVGFTQVSIPFDVVPREVGSGKWSVLALFDLAATALISFTSAPLRIVTFLGFLTLGFAALVTADTLWSWLQSKAVSGFATLEITILVIGSFVMISLGIVGEYIAKIYDEVKERPPFLVASTCGFEEE